jgi:hypothetical protein
VFPLLQLVVGENCPIDLPGAILLTPEDLEFQHLITKWFLAFVYAKIKSFTNNF